MALQKTFNLANGTSGNYIRVGAYRWDRNTREASAQLMLYVAAANAAATPSAPLCLIAKLRLVGAKFDQYLANSVLDGDTVTVVGQLYTAAKAEPLNAGGGFSAVTLSDATNV